MTKGYGKQAAFSVRTGTSLCGIRGTDVSVFFDPDADIVDYKLYEGVVEIKTPGLTTQLEAGNQLRVRGGVPEEPEALRDSES
ncbi:MAG: hypothetical protein AAGG55_00510 [Pseudomonadota bacterium]